MSLPSEQEILSGLSRLEGGRVLILGDLILDEYVYGSTRRISREAPVLIVRHDESVHSPGGGANTAANVASLGGSVLLLGLVGDDAEGRRLIEILENAGIDVGGVLVDGGIDTTKKTRILAGDFHTQRQQVLRLDRENRYPIKESSRRRLIGALADYVQRVDVVLLADYGLGSLDRSTVQKIIAIASQHEVPVVADSRFSLLDYEGATTLTPNEGEMISALGYNEAEGVSVEEAGQELLERLKTKSLVVTRGSLGMMVFERGSPPKNLPVAGSDQVTDLSGAGDTVAAVVALGVARGIDLTLTSVIATFAAGVVVMKRGTAAVTPEEIRVHLETWGLLPDA